ncbi:MAG: helix-turn-helix domain-containing protein [Streptomyces sp.]|nr:helix-turn-helix domain-containing protein [Streptomyces sp.]
MASATLSPDAGPAAEPIQDPVTLNEACVLFAEAGVKVHKSTLERWAKADRLPMQRRGREWVVSYSDLLEAQLRRHPAPGR